jgi:hypothetical protein
MYFSTIDKIAIKIYSEMLNIFAAKIYLEFWKEGVE